MAAAGAPGLGHQQDDQDARGGDEKAVDHVDPGERVGGEKKAVAQRPAAQTAVAPLPATTAPLIRTTKTPARVQSDSRANGS